MFVDYSGAGRDALDYALSRAPAHLAPAIIATRDHNCAFMLVAQSRIAFEVPTGRPAIVILGDDMQRSLGPPGFHLQSLRKFLPRCAFVAVMSGAPVPAVYTMGANAASRGRQTVVLIETTVAHEDEWAGFAEEVVPNAVMHLASPTVASWDAP